MVFIERKTSRYWVEVSNWSNNTEAEPFLNIFRDGRTRDMRVDIPAGIIVESSVSSWNVDVKLMMAKEKGNEFVCQKRYNAASDVYMAALRSTGFLAVTLSNRSNAFVNLEKWRHGFATLQLLWRSDLDRQRHEGDCVNPSFASRSSSWSDMTGVFDADRMHLTSLSQLIFERREGS